MNTYCPYCGKLLHRSRVPYLCGNERCVMHGQPVPVAARAWMDRLPDGVRIRGGRLLNASVVHCGECRRPAVPLCESCGHTLPALWGCYPSLPIVVAGPARSGKSTLVASILHDAMHQRQWSAVALDAGDTAGQLTELYTAPLYERGAYPSPRSDTTLLLGASARVWGYGRNALVAIHDIHGDVASSAVEERHARGVILAVNPVGLPALSGGLSLEAPPLTESGFDRFVRTLLPQARRDFGALSNLPLAVVLTHLDRWFTRLPAALPPHPAFTRDSVRQADGVLRAFLAGVGADFILDAVHTFRHTCFFASGVYAEADALHPFASAHAPMAWILHQNALLGGTRG